MVVKFVSPITLFLPMLLMFQLAIVAATAPSPSVVPVKPNCRRPTCGNLKIPIPFGIGKDCYIHQDFDIECDESVNPPKAILRSVKMEVLDIPLDYSGIVVKGPVISSGCPGRKTGEPVDLTESPLFFSYYNMFTFVGCNGRAFMPESGSAFTGCRTTCGQSFEPAGKNNNTCSGNYCCQTFIHTPDDLRVFNASFKQADGDNNNIQGGSLEGCKRAFLVDSERFDYYNITGLESIPLRLNWLLNERIWKFDENSMVCGDERYLNKTASVRIQCSCHDVGYKGNPYLGCEDINECEDPKLNSCQGLTKCVNVKGSYKCETNKVLIIVLVIGVAIGALLLCMATLWIYKVIMERKNIELKRKFFKRNGGLMLQKQLLSREGKIQKTKVFSSTELENATDCFNMNRIIGQGGQGTVYKGMLEDGRITAVKKSKIEDENKVEEFINEVVILSQINHRNVVKLLGCCLETEVPLLVYEFIPNGSLFQYLHDQNVEEFTLSWEIRLRIAVEVAGALAYLHSAASIPIYHRDIKSANILLDEKYSSKVSDFGTSRSIAIEQTHLTTHVQGTFGYLDPEYFQSSQFTEKSDVYSFGVVLAELVSGRKPIFLNTESQQTISLASHFILSMEENKILEVIDAQVIENCHVEEVIAVANVAKRCLNWKGINRPTMKEVATELEGIRFAHKEINYAQRYVEKDESIINDEAKEDDVLSGCKNFDYAGCKALSLDIESLEVKPLISYGTW